MEVVKQICTKVAVMEGGRVLEIENTVKRKKKILLAVFLLYASGYRDKKSQHLQ